MLEIAALGIALTVEKRHAPPGMLMFARLGTLQIVLLRHLCFFVEHSRVTNGNLFLQMLELVALVGHALAEGKRRFVKLGTAETVKHLAEATVRLFSVLDGTLETVVSGIPETAISGAQKPVTSGLNSLSIVRHAILNGFV
jgi:hypothetical protein